MKQLLKPFIPLWIALLITGTACAQERGSVADAKQMVQDALVHIKEVGMEKAFTDFNTPGGKWHKKDIYLFCYKFDGTNVCQGANKAFVGKNLIDFKSADGQPFIRNVIEIAKTKGSGWIDYQWPHPQTNKIENKRAWVAKIPDCDCLVASGAYK